MTNCSTPKSVPKKNRSIAGKLIAGLLGTLLYVPSPGQAKLCSQYKNDELALSAYQHYVVFWTQQERPNCLAPKLNQLQSVLNSVVAPEEYFHSEMDVQEVYLPLNLSRKKLNVKKMGDTDLPFYSVSFKAGNYQVQYAVAKESGRSGYCVSFVNKPTIVKGRKHIDIIAYDERCKKK